MNAISLVACSMPGSRHVGEILIADSLRALHDFRVQTIAITSNPATVGTLDSTWNSSWLEPPLESAATAKPNWLVGVKNGVRRILSYERFARQKADEVHARVIAAGGSRLWAILDSIAVIDVVYFLVKKFSVPLFVQVWDDPQHLIFLRNLDSLSARRTLGRFRFLIRHAEKVAVISEQMQTAYEPDTQEKPIIIRHGMGSTSAIPCRITDPSQFRIGFCGSMYATTAWKAFQQALYLKRWKLGGKKVQMLIASPVIELDSGTPADMRFYGWQSPHDTVQLMAACDLLYLPQGFEPGQRPITELSFPTKLSTYAQTGKPVFVHSPAYGSLTEFCKQQQFGCLCNDLNAMNIAQMLESLASDSASLDRMALSTRRIGQGVLSREHFQAQVREFLLPDQKAFIG